MPAKITEQTIRRLKAAPPAAGNVVDWDSDVTGFGVRVTKAGSVSFVLRYVQRGRERRLTLGKHPDLSVGAARTMAIELRGDVARGQDPLAERKKGHRTPNVRMLCERYMEEHAKIRKKPSSIAEDKRLIEKKIKPHLGSLRLDSVVRTDIIDLHTRYAATPYESNRVLALLSKMFNLAEVWGLRPDGSNPCRHVKKYPERKRNGAFSADELRRLGDAMRASATNGPDDDTALSALLFLLLTGCRLSEARLLQWSWIRWDDGFIAYPDSKTGPKTHYFGLAADALLRRLWDKRRDASPFVFPAIKDRQAPLPTPTIQHAWQRLRKAAGLDGKRIHDFRHTRGTWAAASGANAFLVRDALAHRNVGTTDRYVRIAADPLRRLNDELDKAFMSAMRQGPPADAGVDDDDATAAQWPTARDAA
ncbi:MAG: tyrosine-type recombinase/integrase [Candidatus Odyssella sp.]|nr:tyrosine-type recombinase/integrase [Candidatus Odyssella sp.]